ncbi:MAG: alpha-amylase family glycosyl hydrolase, partial [Chloroflexota bacterium]
SLFATDGDVVIFDPARALSLAERFVDEDADRARAASEIAAIGLIHELGHRAVAVERRSDPAAGGPMARGLAALDVRLGEGAVDRGLIDYETNFPALPVYRDEIEPKAWLQRARGEVSGREAALEELALTGITARNPAAAAYRELTSHPSLAEAAQRQLLDGIAGSDLDPDDPELERKAPARTLWHRLIEPIEAAPQSLGAQLRWIRIHWAGWLDDADLLHIDRQLGLLDELDRQAWLRAQRAPGSGDQADPAALSGFGGFDDEPEAFSQDRDWMAELVLVAKSTYVWLAQLSRDHGRPISRLDEIPDEELDELRARGFTGLWLIGLWERSAASQRIKQWRGNPDAMASAYSVADYRIADELGGDAAWANLRDRAMARGIRLAADMVPNHMGIDSTWVVERPDLFISSPYPPYPSYSFTGGDLSSDDRVVIQLEDHYWDSSDAAVVFKRIDKATGEERYIYHGNDGTSFPWNDTAQLDYLRAEVREAVIQQILQVARRFSVIRFDAAMVLARRHIQRLWYPLPGHEAGIPSRSAAAVPADELRRLMPQEFWRDVVDRVAAEVPDTLLLAEAFWLMEGYFVRTLGMHRVYNSAFMHMLRDEKNAEYQQVIRETVSFDARILGRYVNFMNNPDERSAIDQFGSDDKYFGVATMLATLPGLPMFGHGQFEGYTEQYGMEFRRAQRDEWPNQWLVDRHRQQISPLLHERWRFSGAAGFRQLTALEGGGVTHDVFAYANTAEHAPRGAAERRSLVVYLNRYPRAHVRIPGVAEALGLGHDPEGFVILHDHRTGLDFLRQIRDLRENGLELALDGYGCHVFLRFEEVSDGGGAGWAELAQRLGLAGVPDAHVALRRMLDAPLREAVGAIFATRVAEEAFLPELRAEHDTEAGADAARASLTAAFERLASIVGADVDTVTFAYDVAKLASRVRSVRPRLLAQALAGWVLFDAIGDLACDGDRERVVAAFDEWDGAAAVGDLARRAGTGDAQAWRASELARALLALSPGQLEAAADAEGLPAAWFESAAVRAATGWNEWEGRTYLSAEAWDEFVDVLAEREMLLDVPNASNASAELRRRAAEAGYRVDGTDGATPGT